MQVIRNLTLILLATGVITATVLPGQAEQRWVSVEKGYNGQGPAIRVVRSDEHETVVRFEFQGFYVEQVTQNEEDFQVLRIPEYLTTLEIGKPELPIIGELIGIPPSSNVSVAVIDSEVTTLTGYRVYPFQTPFISGEEEEKRFDIDRSFYARNELYPAQTARVGEPGIWRDVRVAPLRIYPMKHNPVTGELLIYKTLTVKMEYFGTSDTNVLPPRESRITPEYDRMYRNTILNYDYLNLSPGVEAKQDYDLLIITVDEFYSTLEYFTVWKSGLGIATYMNRTSEIPDRNYNGELDAVDIMLHIGDEYDDHNIRFVLLVGDIDDLPIYVYPQTSLLLPDVTEIPSDSYYAYIAGHDPYPDVAVGRLSITNTEDLINILNKTLAYTSFPGSWAAKTLLIAHAENAPASFQGNCEEIRSASYTKPPAFDVCYGSEGCTNQDIIDRINDDLGIILYSGHGNSVSWARWNTLEQYFGEPEIGQLFNNKPPIAFGMACATNELDQPEDCFGEIITKDDNGAVAYFGATRPSTALGNWAFGRFVFDELFNEENYFIGEASNAATVRISSICEDWIDQAYKGFFTKMYLWLGDPSLEFPSEAWPMLYTGVLYDTSSPPPPTEPEMDPYVLERLRKIIEAGKDSLALLPYPLDPDWPWPPDPWTRDSVAIRETLESFEYGGSPRMADAMCEAVDYLNGFVKQEVGTRLFLFTAAGEDSSLGECSGAPDPPPDSSWCDNPSSWQCRVWNKILNGGIILDVGYFGSGQDKAFLKDLAVASGGGFYDPADTAICGNGVVEPGETCERNSDCAPPGSEDTLSIWCYECRCYCDCLPGEADFNGSYNILDVTHIINYLYKNGEEPHPYATCSGDADCDCAVNLLDVTFLINYLYREGPLPCLGEDWISTCGYLHK